MINRSISFDKSHLDHHLTSFHIWTRKRFGPDVRQRLKEVVLTRIDLYKFEKIIQPKNKRLGMSENISLNIYEPAEASDILKITAQDFHNFHRKDLEQIAELNSSC